MNVGLTFLTVVHVVISLVGIGSGLVVVYGLLGRRRLDLWTAVFLVSTVLTSASGFLFPFDRFLPSHGLAILSLAALAVAIAARYAYHLVGAWQHAYTVAAITSFYFNVFVLIVQLFQKVSALKALAPTQSEPPFLVTQVVVLTVFVFVTVAAALKNRGEPRLTSR
jgi:hypothetical protein